MSRGIGVVSGSSNVRFVATDDGAFIVGRDTPSTIQMSGTLNLRVAGVSGGSNRWLRLTGSDGYSIWSVMSASVVATIPLGNLTSSNVQDALNELQDSVNALSAGSSQYTFSDGVNSELVNGDGSSMFWTGSVNQTEVTYNPANNRFTIGLGRNIVHTGTFTSGPITASNGLRVLNGGITVDAGNTSLQSITAVTVAATSNVFANGLFVTGSSQFGTSGSSAGTKTIYSKFRAPIFTAANVPAEYVNAPMQYVGHTFYLQGAGSGTFPQADKWYYNEVGTWFPSMFFSGS